MIYSSCMTMQNNMLIFHAQVLIAFKSADDTKIASPPAPAAVILCKMEVAWPHKVGVVK